MNRVPDEAFETPSPLPIAPASMPEMLPLEDPIDEIIDPEILIP